MSNETVEKGSNVILAIIFLAIFLAVMLLALVLVFNSVNIAGSNAVGGIITSTGSVINETGNVYINGTGDTLNILATVPTATNCAITSAYNWTSGLLIASGNYTVNTNTCIWTNTTAVVWNNVSVSYTYGVYTSNSGGLNTTVNSIQNSVMGMVINLFALAPVIGTIFAVCILIAGIVLLVMYVRRMKDSGSSGEFHG